MQPEDEIEEIIEKGVGEIYRGFYRLRQAGEYQREFDTMGAIISMLMRDRLHIIKTYEVEI